MSELSDLLNAANEEVGWTSREIANVARKRGFKVAHSSVANYMRGVHPEHPSENTLRMFARVFDLNLERLREAAGVPAEVTSIELPAEATRLTTRQWRAVHEVIRAMVNPRARDS